MSLEFRSSTPERRVVLETDPDGRERIAVATREPHQNHWTCKLTHPSGQVWTENYHGERVTEALGHWMDAKRHEFKLDKARGDRPIPKDSNPMHIAPYPDYKP